MNISIWPYLLQEKIEAYKKSNIRRIGIFPVLSGVVFWIVCYFLCPYIEHQHTMIQESRLCVTKSRANTPGSMNSLFSDLFRECWRGTLGGVRDDFYLGEVLGGF